MTRRAIGGTMRTMSVSLVLLLFVAAVLYTAAGQAGASGYIAVMALHGVVPEVMKPTALCLNVLVASFGTWRLARAGWIAWTGLWPWLIASVPMAFLGGMILVPPDVYRWVVGVVLLYAALRLWRDAGGTREPRAIVSPPILGQIVSGGAVGLVSGLTGLGGGVLLGPLVLMMGWASPRQTAGLTTPFILVNSIAGLAGNAWSVASLPAELPVYAAATLAGSAVGTHLAIHRLSPAMLQRIMAVVLILGGGAVLLGR